VEVGSPVNTEVRPVAELILEAPSGLAGNLLATALVRAGVPGALFDALPWMLGLEDFRVVWDDHGVCDGEGGVFDGEMGHLIDHACSRIRVDLAPMVRNTLRLAFPPGKIEDHDACDLVFDTVAFFCGLAVLGWPKVAVVGPLPVTDKDHTTTGRLLSTWERTPVSCDLELVTPTAASLLTVSNARQLDRRPDQAVLVGEVFGRYARQAKLPPVRVWVTDHAHSL
jgi:hypothetical protein